jgi:hypothetical protein
MERRGILGGLGGSVICPIFKKGEKNRAENYRGITLPNTGYKLYASVLSERMKREIEEKGVLPDSQGRVQKGGVLCTMCTSWTCNKERIEEERGEDVRIVRRLQGGVRQG